VDHWGCELRFFDGERNVVGEVRRSTFERYEQARAFADIEVAEGARQVGAIVFALRRARPHRDDEFLPGEVVEPY